jgi:hypothetical protein
VGALLDYTAGRAGDVQLARVTGVESEMDLSYAAIHQMLVQFLDGIGRLPAAAMVPPPSRIADGLTPARATTVRSGLMPFLRRLAGGQAAHVVQGPRR